MTTSLKILQEITTGYSIFEKDQVLTERQLNSVTDYLNDQTRLTRIYLLGVGVGSGLQVSLSSTEISVTRGMGITTDGDLLYYPNDTLFDRFTLYDTSQPKYTPFYVGGNINGTMLTVYELVRQSAVDPRTTLFPLSEFTPQTTKNLADMVAVLLMESYVNDPDLCTGTDCDNLGQDCINTIKLLLVEKVAINQFLHPAIATPDRAFKALNEIIVDRPLIPSSLSSTSQLAQIYRAACTTIHEKILSELPNLYLNCATLLGTVFPSDPTANWTSRLISINNIYSSDLGIQYYYDFLKDWVQTYHHFRSLLEGNTTWCCPDTNAFPKHLMLGNLVTNDDPNENRTGFYPSPLLNYHDNSLEHAKFLARKLDTLIQTFQVPTASTSAPIRITPSLFEDQCLEQRAIPYYYSVNLTHPIHQQWNYDLHRRGMDTYNYSYNASTYLAQGGAANPFGSQLGQFSFFRIEGYLGQNLDTAVKAISQLIQSNNLPFSIQAAHLGTTTLPGGVDFQELLSQEPSLEHFGGVTRGGTLVLLADPNNGTVIADFLLPSLPRSPGSSTCTVMVKPSDNLAVVLGTIANGQDAHICLAEGTYNLSAQLRLENKGHLTISGNGKGTRIIAPGIETLFEFSNCKSISIRDCSLENAANQAGIPKGFANNLEDLRGLLTILNCPSVELEKLSLRCAHQAVRSASCITVRQNLAVANTQVRIRHCDLEVGYQQIGILLVNVERSQIEDNKIQVDRSNSFDTLNALAAQPQYRLRLLPRLVANAYLGTSIPSGGATRLRYNASNVTVSFSEQSLRWKSDLASDAWLGLLNAQNPLVQNRQDLLKAVKQLARQILLDDTFRSNHPIFNTWYQTLNKPGTIIASQGIVVAGSRAEEVRILNNTLQGFLQGIHIGISPRATYRAGSVLLSGNRIEVAAPIDQNQERHGIYVSSCDSLIIENNYLQAMGTFFQPIEGIRVSGRLGRMVIIRQNHLTGFSLGIYFNPLDTYGTATMMQWFVSDNMASGAQTFMRVVSNRPGTEGTQITSKVRVSNNFQ